MSFDHSVIRSPLKSAADFQKDANRIMKRPPDKPEPKPDPRTEYERRVAEAMDLGIVMVRTSPRRWIVAELKHKLGGSEEILLLFEPVSEPQGYSATVEEYDRIVDLERRRRANAAPDTPETGAP